MYSDWLYFLWHGVYTHTASSENLLIFGERIFFSNIAVNLCMLGASSFPVPLPFGLELDISLPSLLHVVIFVLLIVMAGRHSWRGIYKVVIPHLVCLLWWQLFTELFHFTSWGSLLRASLGWVIFVTMLPLLLFFTIGVTLAYFLQWFMTLDFAVKLAVTAVVIATSSAIFYYAKLEIPHADKIERKKKPLITAAALVVLCLLFPIVYINFVPTMYGSDRPLLWREYNNGCVSKYRGGDVNIAVAQIACNEFNGASVNWTGTVAYVKLSSVENRFRGFVSCLPRFVQPTLKCLLGEEENDSEDRYVDKHKKRTVSTNCHLHGIKGVLA